MDTLQQSRCRWFAYDFIGIIYSFHWTSLNSKHISTRFKDDSHTLNYLMKMNRIWDNNICIPCKTASNETADYILEYI